MRCANCKYMHYCSKECQRTDWSVHRHECPKFQTATEFQGDDLTRILIRILIKLKIDRSALNSLCDHYEELTKDALKMRTLRVISRYIGTIMGPEFFQDFTSKELVSSFGKVVINCLKISNYDMSENLGTGIYLSISKLDHSCAPNCVVVFDGIKADVRVIKGFASEAPVISYASLLSIRDDRQKFLKENYYFTCVCSRCIKSEGVVSAAKTYIDQIRAIVFKPGFDTLPAAEKELADFGLKELMLKCWRTDEKDGSEDKSFVVSYCENQMDHNIEDQLFDEALQVAIEYLIPGYNLYVPEYHPTKSLMFMKIVKIALYLDDFKTARKFYSKAEEGLSKSHDSGHPLIKELKKLYCQL